MVSRLRSPSAMSFRKLNLLQPQVGKMLLLSSSKVLLLQFMIFSSLHSRNYLGGSRTGSRGLHRGLEDVIEFNTNIE